MQWALVFVAMLPIWFSIGDHALRGRTEGRYASVARSMAQSGDWLVPRFQGHPHLTKPPLIYWLEAAAIRMLGPTEYAVRLPSAVAGTLLCVAAFALARRIAGPRHAITVAALLAVTPLNVIVSRATATDSVLALTWFGTLAAGLLSTLEPQRRRWTRLLWFCVGVGLFTKGPLALVPVGLVALWLGLAGRWADIGRLRPIIGTLAAVLPLIVWGLLIWRREPDAIAIWKHETFDRVVGSGDHVKPWWFYFPVLLVGLFPLSIMVSLPGVNFAWSEVRGRLRNASASTLWALSVIVPFVGFTIMKGKLFSYLLPLAAPMAMLAATTVCAWLDNTPGARGRAERRPWIAVGLAIALGGMFIAALVSAIVLLGSQHAWVAAPMLPAALVSVWMWWRWNRQPTERWMMLGILWLSGVLLWMGVAEVEDFLWDGWSSRRLFHEVSAQAHTPHPAFATLGFADTCLPFYSGTDIPELHGREGVSEAIAAADGELLVIAEAGAWKKLEHKAGETTAQFEEVGRWQPWPLGSLHLILRNISGLDVPIRP